jgi:hypothetical protein
MMRARLPAVEHLWVAQRTRAISGNCAPQRERLSTPGAINRDDLKPRADIRPGAQRLSTVAAGDTARPYPSASSAIAQLGAAAGGAECARSPGARECKTLQSVSLRREDAGRNRRNPDGIGAIKLEAARSYHLYIHLFFAKLRLNRAAP